MPRAAGQQSLDFEGVPLAADRLLNWPPDVHDLDEGWRPLVEDFSSSPVGRTLSARLSHELAEGKIIYPPQPYRALSLTPLGQVRVVILGQDPYHGPGQAEGLAFSVAPGEPVPPSLRNIFKELHKSLKVPIPAQGSLVRWAKQGVLLLNTCLTVEAGQAASHARWGWEALTDALITTVAQSPRPVVFMLWGALAQTKKTLLDAVPGSSRHLILQANHPSPLSALRPPTPFLGCDHFLNANRFLAASGEKPITW